MERSSMPKIPNLDVLRFFRRSGSDSTGQALVETAMAIAILIPVLIGTADLVRVFRAAIAVSNAAKAGAQYAIQNGATAQDATGIQNAASAEAPNLTIVATPSYTCICSDGSASTCQNSDCPTSHLEQTVTVQTSADVTPLIHLPSLPKTYTLKGKAIQRCLQ
jgi:Flp pilus assembly protein TadG